MMKISGVYKITNSVTGDFYVGSSKNVKHRWACHKSPSTWTLYPRMKLYQDFIKYGLNNFMFEVIEDTNDLHTREQYYIEQLKPSYNSIRANGWDSERYINTIKVWHQAHRNEELARSKAYHQAHRDEDLTKGKAYRDRICFYYGETLTLHALSQRLYRQGIPHATIEAKKYLIEGEN